MGDDAEKYFETVISNNWQTIKENLWRFSPIEGTSYFITDGNASTQEKYNVAFYKNLYKDCESIKDMEEYDYLRYCFKVPKSIMGDDAQKYFETVLSNNWQIIKGNMRMFLLIENGKYITGGDRSTQRKYNIAFYSKFFSSEDCKAAKDINDYEYLQCCFKAPADVIGDDAQKYFDDLISGNWDTIKKRIYYFSPIENGISITGGKDDTQKKYNAAFYTKLHKDCKSTSNMTDIHLKECLEISIQFFNNDKAELEEYLEATIAKNNLMIEENIQRLLPVIGKLINSDNKAKIISLIMKKENILPSDPEARRLIFLSFFNQLYDNDDKSTIVIKRDHVLESFITNFQEIELAKKPTGFEFDGEPGVDAGGLTKEAFSLLANSLSNFKNGLLTLVPDSSKAGASKYNGLMNLQHFSNRKFEDFEAFGRIMANALLYKHLLPLNLSLLFYKKLLEKGLVEDDLKYVNSATWDGLSAIKNVEKDGYIGLGFIVTESYNTFAMENDVEVSKTEWKNIDLIKFNKPTAGELKEFFGLESDLDSVNGNDIDVAFENKDTYVQYVTNYHLHKDKKFMEAFKNGFFSVIAEKDIFCQLFKPEDIRKMLEGESIINVEDWKNNSQTEHCAESDARVDLFWKVLSKADQEFLKKLLQFSTALSRLPAGGFAFLEKKYIISCINEDDNPKRLITVSTCLNKIKLPRYTTKEEALESITKSIEYGMNQFSLA